MSNSPDYLKYKTEKIEIDEHIVKYFTTQKEFNELGIGLFKEISTLIVPVASIYGADLDGKKMPYKHEEAALIGNMVRYSKLCCAFLEQFAKNRVETSLIFLRSLAETYVNIKYFLKFGDENTLRHYIKHSLRQERNLLEIIKSNIPNGEEQLQEIEKRIMASIRNSFRVSYFEEEEIGNSSKWEAKVKSRIKEIIDPNFYILIYGNASHAVHGNWQDLISCHLERFEDGFLPQPNWTAPTLQILTAATVLSCDLLKNYAEDIIPESENSKRVIEATISISMRAFKLDEQHELFIQKL